MRPLPSLLDEEKVQTFVREVEVIKSTASPLAASGADSRSFLSQRGDEFTPIEVLRVRSPANPDQSYYFSLGGCHRCVPLSLWYTHALALTDTLPRFEAHKRLGRETIRGKVIEVPASVMKKYLGSSAPF